MGSISKRKIATFILLALLGSLVITLGISKVRIPYEPPYDVIHETFSKKVCKLTIIEHSFEEESVKKAFGHEGLSIKCELIDLNDPRIVTKQVLAAVIFYVSLLAAIMFWERRVAAVFLGFVALILTGTLPFHVALEAMELDLIVFLMAMMALVGYLKETGFLRFISAKLLLASRHNPKKLLFILMLLSFVLAALVDEVSSIVYVTMLVFEIAEIVGFNPLPWVIIAVFATNLGSAATMIGNPIGIYIGLHFKLTFPDFLRFAAPAAFTALVCTYPIASYYLRNDLNMLNVLKSKEIVIDPWAEVKNKTDFYLAAVLFTVTIIAIGLHTELANIVNAILKDAFGPHAPRLGSHDVLVLIPVVTSAIAIFRSGFKARKLIEERVEWWALIFFMFLFAEAAALSYTGVTDKLAYLILAGVSGGHLGIMAGVNANLMMMVVSAITSGFVDNMPIIVALSPVADTLMAANIPGHFMLPWSLLFGGTMGGNLTVIGSTANIVAASMVEKRGYRIEFGEWIRIGSIVVTVTLCVAAAWVMLHIAGVL